MASLGTVAGDTVAGGTETGDTGSGATAGERTITGDTSTSIPHRRSSAYSCSRLACQRLQSLYRSATQHESAERAMQLVLTQPHLSAAPAADNFAAIRRTLDA